jgi:hypothetical protein
MPVTNLPFIQEMMIRYGMTTYLALGLVGNMCNCIVFIQPINRHKSTSVFFLSLSIIGILHLIWSVSPLIYSLDHIDFVTQSVFYCKMKMYGSHVLGQCLRSIIVLACIDRFIVTRANVRIRALNSVQTAVKLVFITCASWFIIAVHIPILVDISVGVCGMSGLYKLIYPFYQLMVCTILPPIVMIIFGTLTIHSLYRRNLVLRRTQRKDRYLMRMVMAEVIVNILTSTPYSIDLIYGVATYNIVDKSAQRLEIESFMNFITQFFAYFIGVTPFYLFMLISKPFRKEFIRILIKCRNKYILRHNRIAP